MEGITSYLYMSFSVFALPCVVIVFYGIFQRINSGKNDKMQRLNNQASNGTGNNSNANSINNNNNSNNNSNNKRCAQQQKVANASEQHQAQQHNHNNNNNSNSNSNNNNSNNYKNGGRKSRSNNKRQDAQKRNNGNNLTNAAATAAQTAAARQEGATTTTCSNSVTSSWISHKYEGRFVSSDVEDKFLSKHSTIHRNSTSSEATIDDIDSSTEQLNKNIIIGITGNNRNNNSNNNSNSKAKGNNKPQGKRQQQLQQHQQLSNTPQGGKQCLQSSNNKQQQVGNKAARGKQFSGSNNNNSGINKPALGCQQKQNNNNCKRQSNNNKRNTKQQQQQQQQQQLHSNHSSSASSGINQSHAKYHNNNNNNNNNNKQNNIVKRINNCNSSNNNRSTLSLAQIYGGCGTDTSSALSSANSSPAQCSDVAICSAGDSQCAKQPSIGEWQRHERQARQAQARRQRQQALLQRHRQCDNPNFDVPALRQYENMDMDDSALVQQLRSHVIDTHLLRVYGFPVESAVHDGAIEVFKCLPHMTIAAATDLAAAAGALTVINSYDGLPTSSFQYGRGFGALPGSNMDANVMRARLVDVAMQPEPRVTRAASQQASTDSGNISPRSLDSEEGSTDWSECEQAANTSGAYTMAVSADELLCQYAERSLAKQCVRCKRDFLVDEHTGQYLTQERCTYHWGKYQRHFDGNAWTTQWSCCNATDEEGGCCHHELHVWTGSVVGVNGPYRDFVRTRSRQPLDSHQQPQVFALDCEMSYTGRGLEVTKVSLVSLNGQLVYEHFVQPEADIVDYNTRFSGITAKDLKSDSVKTLPEVQRDLLQLIDAETILIGHGLDNDLRALRLVHQTLIDTSISFPHSSGFPYRRALRHLTKTHLKREIQLGEGSTGHSSFEDSRACMELMLWRVRRELDMDYWDE